MRDLDLRQRGWTQKDIDGMDREEDVRFKKWEECIRQAPGTLWCWTQPRTQAQMNARFRAWDAAGLNRGRQNDMAISYGFNARPASIDQQAESEGELDVQWKEWEEEQKNPPKQVLPNQPQDQKEMDERFRTWDALGVDRKKQNEMAGLYGFAERPSSPDGHAVREELSQSRAQSSRRRRGYFSQNPDRSNHKESVKGTRQYSAPTCSAT